MPRVSITKRFPRIFILLKAKSKLDAYINQCPTEISGLGKVVKIGDDFVIEDIFLLKQVCSPTHTQLDKNDLAEYMLSAASRGESLRNIRVWWHSHAYLDSFWSTEDDSTATSFRGEWMISIVGNKKGKFLVRLDLFKPFRVTFDELPLVVKLPDSKNLSDDIEREIAQKVDVIIPKHRKGQSQKLSYPQALDQSRQRSLDSVNRHNPNQESNNFVFGEGIDIDFEGTELVLDFDVIANGRDLSGE